MAESPDQNGNGVTYPQHTPGRDPEYAASSGAVPHVLMNTDHFVPKIFDIETVDLHIKHPHNYGYLPAHRAVLAGISGFFQREIARCRDDEAVCTIRFERLGCYRAFELCVSYGYRGNAIFLEPGFGFSQDCEIFWFSCELYGTAHFLEMPMLQDQVLHLIGHFLDVVDRRVDPSSFYADSLFPLREWAIGQRAQFRADIAYRILDCSHNAGMIDILYIFSLWFHECRWHQGCSAVLTKITARFPDLEDSILQPEGSPFEHIWSYTCYRGGK